MTSRSRLLERVFEHDHLADLDPAERRLALRELVAPDVSGSELGAVVRDLADHCDGFGPLTELMTDDRVSDVLVNGPREVWAERDGTLERTAISFASEDDLLSFAERALARAGQRLDGSRPIADGRLPDGSRIHAVLPPIAPGGPLVSIRRVAKAPMSLATLTASGMLTESQSDRLQRAVADRASVAIGGGTGTGKTTLLNALIGEVPESERVVVIEETRELRPPGGHWVSLVGRSPNLEGAGEIDLRSLVRAALRMRPDRIVIGEVRGAEALDALGAMSTGHEGSMVTVHARSARAIVARLAALATQAGTGAGEASLIAQARESFDVLVQVGRRGARRNVLEIVEA